MLTSGGHNAGIVSPPGHPRRHYQLLTSPAGQRWAPIPTTGSPRPEHPGSWWPAWHEWLRAHSGDPSSRRAPPAGERPGRRAGRYVLEKWAVMTETPILATPHKAVDPLPTVGTRTRASAKC